MGKIGCAFYGSSEITETKNFVMSIIYTIPAFALLTVLSKDSPN
jgi:hypothetical protein